MTSRWARAVCAVVAIFAGPFVLLVPAAAAATATLTVTPSTGLVDGQSVMVTGAGWTPNAFIGFCQGVASASPSSEDCANGAFTSVTVDGNGGFTSSLIVHRTIVAPRTGVPVDCADPSNPCVVGAAQADDIPVTAVEVTIEFNPNTCAALVAQPHTSFTLSNAELVGSVATFVADPDYVLSGSASLTCHPDHTWNGAPPSALFTGTPVVVPGSASVLEGNSGQTQVVVPVTLSQASAATVTAQWATRFVPDAPAGQADPATDYVPASGTLTFLPGDTVRTIRIRINGDVTDEPDEYIIVPFDNLTNATIGGFYGIGFGGIINDDHARLVPGGASVLEGDSGTVDVNVPVTLSNPSSRTVTAHWATRFVPDAPAGEADPATDYTPASGTVTFAPGQTAKTVPISITGDTLVEPDEYIVVVFDTVTNATIGGFYGIGFGGIVNDD